MASKLYLVILTTQLLLVTSGKSLFQGISFQRGFEINFKPLPKQPFAFIKESWSPFGVFGKKFAIQKRSLDDIVPVTSKRYPRPAAPVFEHIDEEEHMGTRPLLILPRPSAVSPSKPPINSPQVPEHIPLPVPMPIIVNDFPPLSSNSHLVPPIATNMVILQPTKVVNNHVLSTRGLYTDISRVELVKEHIHTEPAHPEASAAVEQVIAHAPGAPYSESESQVAAEPVPIINKPAAPIEPVPAPPEVAPVEEVSQHPAEPISPPAVVEPIEPVLPIPTEPIPPPPASLVVPVQPPAAESSPSIPPKAPEPPKPVIVEEVKEVITPPVPTVAPKTEIVLKENAFIKGSKMALQFGTVFLTLMAQFLDSARASIDIMTNPPPKFQK